MGILEDISQLLQKGKSKKVKELVQQAIDEGIDAKVILDEGLLAGMNAVGDQFQAGEIFVPEAVSYTHLDVYKRQILQQIFWRPLSF